MQNILKLVLLKLYAALLFYPGKNSSQKLLKSQKNYHGIHAHDECVRVIDDLF